ncbi:DUF2937 family protein [Shewanella surugensis]|uniref:DUF2937 family protein n=1 Tax=Shewanella surugensis TaxID=212020 RepID=A0ABT0L7V5_9GAMM|nr:DUF2937 family protein [Shewanella surugensis]MCL1123769.1 DUF2937 family protein [Shewanella surugensis]
MKKIIEYLRLMLFMAGVLVGIQAPSVVDQYGKRLQAQLTESKLSLNAFQGDADRYFGGSIDKLITYYQSNDDPVFNDAGTNVEGLMQRQNSLSMAWQRFSADEYSPYIQFIWDPLLDIKAAVLKNYTYSIVLNSKAIMVGLIAGGLLAAAAELLLTLIWQTLRLTRRVVFGPVHPRRRL